MLWSHLGCPREVTFTGHIERASRAKVMKQEGVWHVGELDRPVCLGQRD